MTSDKPRTARTALRSLKRRRSARGAALVEALIAIPFFILIFASTLFLEELYGEKTRTMREAREAAWGSASAACEGGPTAGGGTLEDAANFDLGDAAGAPGTDLVASEFGDASAKVSSSAAASSLLGAFSVPIESATTVACNEKRHDTNLGTMVKYMWNLFKP